ncbi:Alpha/Beta hydrolase protein [Mycena epipterygia]|nr:Alpha/Beta hydrolase protein [Mycena epipterygia]
MSASIPKLWPSADGTLIYAEASGNPANPSVVFAHGFALSGIVFDKLFSDPRLLDKLYLVRYDVRGHGRSGKPVDAKGYASSLYAADFSAVIKAFSLNMPVFVGWSAGALITSDICSHISPVPLSGAISLCGPLCADTAPKTLKPKLLEMIPKFCSSDAATALQTRVEFVDAVFTDPENVPFSTKAAWMGSTVLQSPEVTTAMLTGHQPNQTKLVELGSQGFPVMILYGTKDQIQDGNIGASEARPYFTNLEVAAVEGGSHSIFYDSVDETLGHILRFCLRVSGQLAGYRRPIAGDGI